MGFRSTLAAYETDTDWPDWFRDKHRWILAGNQLTTTREIKTYIEPVSSLPGDVQRALTETGWFDRRKKPFVFVWLHQCGGITRIEVHQDRVYFTEPSGWEFVPDGIPAPDLQDGTHEDWHNECSAAAAASPSG